MFRRHKVAEDARRRLGHRIAVSAGGCQVFLYAGTEVAAREAERIAREVLAEHHFQAGFAIHHWHPLEERLRKAQHEYVTLLRSRRRGCEMRVSLREEAKLADRPEPGGLAAMYTVALMVRAWLGILRRSASSHLNLPAPPRRSRPARKKACRCGIRSWAVPVHDHLPQPRRFRLHAQAHDWLPDGTPAGLSAGSGI